MPTKADTVPKPFCFVLMPFNDDLNDQYEFGIKGACEETGAYCERVDEQVFQGSIINRIYNQIAKADIIIADMTGRNANVFYEVGYAHALGKQTILLTKKANDIPFDLKDYQHIIFTSVSNLKDSLKKHIEILLENKSTIENPSKIGIKLYCNGQDLASENVVIDCELFTYPTGIITIHNTSSHTYQPGDLKIGLIANNKLLMQFTDDWKKIPLLSNQSMYMSTTHSAIFPDGYEAIEFNFTHKLTVSELKTDTGQIINVRLFTQTGRRDYMFRCKWHHENIF